METAEELPSIRGVSAKIACLERRRAHCQAQVDEGRGSKAGLSFAKEEVSALTAALQSLKFYRAEVDGMDDAVVVVRDFLAATEDIPDSGMTLEQQRALIKIRKRARELLVEWE
jgi:hypothetical protein